jgi:hypothetical protein
VGSLDAERATTSGRWYEAAKGVRLGTLRLHDPNLFRIRFDALSESTVVVAPAQAGFRVSTTQSRIDLRQLLRPLHGLFRNRHSVHRRPGQRRPPCVI